jgi:hypothetical protein
MAAEANEGWNQGVRVSAVSQSNGGNMSDETAKVTRADVMKLAHEMSCTHQHIRADECPICMKAYLALADDLERTPKS